jgi:hypothetical protein
VAPSLCSPFRLSQLWKTACACEHSRCDWLCRTCFASRVASRIEVPAYACAASRRGCSRSNRFIRHLSCHVHAAHMHALHRICRRIRMHICQRGISISISYVATYSFRARPAYRRVQTSCACRPRAVGSCSCQEIHTRGHLAVGADQSPESICHGIVTIIFAYAYVRCLADCVVWEGLDIHRRCERCQYGSER